MITPASFLTETLQDNEWGKIVCRILDAAIQAVDPGEAVRQFMRRENDLLIIGNHRIHLDQVGRVRIAGMGKAGAPMTAAAADILGKRLADGVVIVKQG